MSLDEQTQTVRPTRRYLFFPWFVLLPVWLASETGITDWISTVLPFGLGRIAIRNLWPGMLLLLIGCSAIWALEVARSWDYRGVELILWTIWLTCVVTITQLCIFLVGRLLTPVVIVD